MHQLKRSGGKTSDLSEQMLIIKDFIDEFYNKTVFHGEKALNSDLTPSQIKSLFAFEKDDHEYPIGELGKNARVKSSTMTDMIDRLEQDGIVERIRDDGDRRVVKVRLTDKGKKMYDKFVGLVEDGQVAAGPEDAGVFVQIALGGQIVFEVAGEDEVPVGAGDVSLDQAGVQIAGPRAAGLDQLVAAGFGVSVDDEKFQWCRLVFHDGSLTVWAQLEFKASMTAGRSA